MKKQNNILIFFNKLSFSLQAITIITSVFFVFFFGYIQINYQNLGAFISDLKYSLNKQKNYNQLQKVAYEYALLNPRILTAIANEYKAIAPSIGDNSYFSWWAVKTNTQLNTMSTLCIDVFEYKDYHFSSIKIDDLKYLAEYYFTNIEIEFLKEIVDPVPQYYTKEYCKDKNLNTIYGIMDGIKIKINGVYLIVVKDTKNNIVYILTLTSLNKDINGNIYITAVNKIKSRLQEEIDK